jgi:WD40 repeat protein
MRLSIMAAGMAIVCVVVAGWAQTPAFEVTDTAVQVEGGLPLAPGVPVVIMARYRNVSAATATETVWLEIDGVRVAETTLSLTSGTREKVTFTRTFDRSGVYKAKVCTRYGCEDFTVGVASPGFLRTLSEDEYNVNAIAFSPDGKTLASAAELWGNVPAIKLWDVGSGTLLRSLSGGKGYLFFSLAFSPDGKTLASGSADETVKLWDVATGTLLRTISGPEGDVDSVAFSPDGRMIAAARGPVPGTKDYNAVQLWDAATGTLVRSLSGYTNDNVCQRWVMSAAFSPDGKTLACGSGDKTILLWDVTWGTLVRVFSGHTEFVDSVVFSPDGKTLASGSGDKTIMLWDVATGRRLGVLTGHDDWVQSVAFSPDGKTLASGSLDLTIKLWDVATGTQLRSCTGHMGGVRSVAFSPDGKTLASCAEDGTIMLWDASTGTPSRAASGCMADATSVAVASGRPD